MSTTSVTACFIALIVMGITADQRKQNLLKASGTRRLMESGKPFPRPRLIVSNPLVLRRAAHRVRGEL